MLPINNVTNFTCDNIREAIKNGVIQDDNYIIILYLYTNNDFLSYEMLRQYGKNLQRILNFLTMYTFYPEEFLDVWGDKYICAKKVRNEFVQMKVSDVYKKSNLDSYATMIKIRKSYEIDDENNPYIVLINPKTGDFESFVLKLEDYTQSNRATQLLYKDLSNIIEKIYKSIEYGKIYFSDIVHNVKRAYDSRNTSRCTNNVDNYEEKQIKNIIINYIDKGKQRYYHSESIKIDDVYDQLGLTKSSFNARFTARRNQPFTKDESLTIAFTLGMELDETEDFLALIGYKFTNTIRDQKIKEIFNDFRGENISNILDSNGSKNINDFFYKRMVEAGFFDWNITRNKQRSD